MEDYFAAGYTSLRNQVLSRYAGFYRKLLNSPSKEVRFMVHVVSDDARSTTCKNLRLLRSLTGFRQAEAYSSAKIKSVLPIKVVPQSETWRLGLLTSLLSLHREKRLVCDPTMSTEAMISSLCST